jgi:hypothetical protein
MYTFMILQHLTFSYFESSIYVLSNIPFFFQEVECAVSCTCLVVSTFDDKIQGEIPMCLPILVDCVHNIPYINLISCKLFHLYWYQSFSHWFVQES